MNTTENNKLIAKFMGWRCESSIYWVPQFTRDYLSSGAGICDTHNFYGHQLLFHKDWNWIMAVVEVIEEMDVVASFEINQPSIWIWASSESSTFEDIEIDIFTKSKSQAVYKACIEFIKWYNSNLKTK